VTVSNQTNRTSATGTNTAGQAISYSFPANLSSDLVVKTRVTVTGVEATLTLTTDYTATVSDTGGTVTMVAAIPATKTIHIIRDTPNTQSLDLVTGGSFDAESLEDSLDKVTKLAIENKDKLTRALRAPATDPTSLDMELPNSVDRASKTLTFDADGKPTATAAATTTVSFSAYGESLVDDANAVVAQGTLALKDGSADLDIKTLQVQNQVAAITLADVNADSFISSSSPMVNVKHPDFGATGDGVTDDTTAVNLAKTAAEVLGGKLYFPNGVYLIDSLALSGNHGVYVVGESQGTITVTTGVTLKCRSVVTDFITIAGNRHQMHNIRIDGNNKATNCIRFGLANSTYMSFRHLEVHNPVDGGVNVLFSGAGNPQASEMAFYNCNFDGGRAGASGITNILLDSTNVINVAFYSCTFGAADPETDVDVHCYIKRSSAFFYDCFWVDAKSYDVRIGTGTPKNGTVGIFGGRSESSLLDAASISLEGADGHIDIIGFVHATDAVLTSLNITSAFAGKCTVIGGQYDTISNSSAEGCVLINVDREAGAVNSGTRTDRIVLVDVDNIKRTETLLGSAVVDMQNGDSKTTAYNVPAGLTAIITKVIIRSPSGSLASGSTGDFDIGSGANADTWLQTINLDTLTAVTDYMVITSENQKYTMEAAGAAFGIKPITGATANVTATMDVWGYLF